MDTSCYVSVTDPVQPSIVRARYVHFDGYPLALIPQLRGIWAKTARRDTHALIDAVLAHDWFYLGFDITRNTRSFPNQHPVRGVGVTLDDAPEPVTVFPLSRAVDLGASWIYVISPTDDTVSVHTGDGDPVGVHPLGSPATRRTTVLPDRACPLVQRHATPSRAPMARPYRARHLDRREPR
ncbi:hypothetical protein AB0H28_25685 [Micromonospora sp. NPDC050980]|uniref:hypothetical protein n=1 Tax=Micromonospora sp. NPDC050980 TaxID=3155161 RepID=UPI0033DA4E1C